VTSLALKAPAKGMGNGADGEYASEAGGIGFGDDEESDDRRSLCTRLNIEKAKTVAALVDSLAVPAHIPCPASLCEESLLAHSTFQPHSKLRQGE
jgi:hypothetical protein